MNKEVVQNNFRNIQSQILKVCNNRSLGLESVVLVAVSKTHPSEKIRWIYEMGQRDFGENYVQEAMFKQQELADLPIRWHFIGRLQKNKVKNVVGKFDLIHSVDDYELAFKISQKAESLGIYQKILLEVNLAGEITKGGIPLRELEKKFLTFLSLPNIQLVGLMALPPLVEQVEDIRVYFQTMQELFQRCKSLLPEKARFYWKILSMGTTQDFSIAIEEGANMIRVGTAIFGKREHIANTQRIE